MGIADDVAEFGRSEVEQDANLHNFMRVSREHGLVFNCKKCAIKTPQISFFDTIYDEKGVHPDPKKVEDIKMLPTPEHSAADVGHIDVNLTVDKISERLYGKGFNPLWNVSKLHDTPAMPKGDFNACFIEGLRNKSI